MKAREKRLVPRLFTGDAWDIPRTETWLAARAAKGLHFRRCGTGLVWFERGERRAVRYRLEVVSPVSPTPDREKRTQAEKMGWRYVAPMGSGYSVYVSGDPAAPELHTDPVTQSYTMDALARRLKRIIVVLAACLLGMLLLQIPLLQTKKPPVLQLVEGGGVFGAISSTAVTVLIIAGLLVQCVRFLSLRRRLRAGLPMEHGTDFRCRTVFNVGLLIAAALFAAASLASSYVSVTGYRSWNITAETPSPLDFHLHQIEPPDGFGYTHLFPEAMPEVDLDSNVRAERSLLVPERYSIVEEGTTDADGEAVRASLRIEYYSLALPILAGPLLDDLIWNYTISQNYDAEAYTLTSMTVPGFDGLTLAEQEGDDALLLFARLGGQVVYLRHYGTGDLTAALSALAEALRAREA